jgi:hypothetical protein
MGAFITILSGLVWGVAVLAQEADKTIDGAMLQLWPEYDDPGLLVIYSGDFTDTLSFPLEIAFPLPSGARGIQATSKETDGRLISQQWQIVDGKLVYTLPGPGFHVEYYLDRPPSGNQRDISYAFVTPYVVDTLDIRVQQPARATEFSLTPPFDGTVPGDDGLTYSEMRKTNLKPGDRLDFRIRYGKPDQGLTRLPSVSAEAAPTAPGDAMQATQDESIITSWLPYLLIGVGLLALIAAAIYWLLRSRGAPAPMSTGASDANRAKRTASALGPGKDTVFCTRCGRKFGAEDRFCAHCGAPR